MKKSKKIRVLNIENEHSSARVTYETEYSDGSTDTVQMNVKSLKQLSAYSTEPHVVKAECAGTVYLGLIKTDTRLVFIVTLSNFSVDIIQAKEGTSECDFLLAKCNTDHKSATVFFEVGNELNLRTVDDITIPIEVLSNSYALRLSNVSVKHHLTYENGKKTFDYVTLKCKVNYYLNGRKEGKRNIIFVSYDNNGGVLEVRGENKKIHFTEAGYEFVEICFNDCGADIAKISVSVREV